MFHYFFLMETNHSINPIFAPIGATGHLVYINELNTPVAIKHIYIINAHTISPSSLFSARGY